VLRDISLDIPSGQIGLHRRAFGLWKSDPAADAMAAWSTPASAEVCNWAHRLLAV